MRCTRGGILTLAVILAACAEPATRPADPAPGDPAIEEGEGLEHDVALHRDRDRGPGSVVRWNRESVVLFRSRTPPSNFGRINTYLGVAQYRAVKAVRCGVDRRGAMRAGAAAGASVVVLKEFYPLDVAAIDAVLAAQRAEYDGQPRRQAAFDEGVALGRGYGQGALDQAATDNFGVAPLPVQPVGPGYWVSSGAPTVKGGYGARPFVLTSGDEINAPPPPAFGSTAFEHDLAEVLSLSENRTPEQVAITQKWVPFSGPLFSELAADLTEQRRFGELTAARVFAYANVAAYDAIIGCFHTKFTYWFIRPTQANPAITLATGLPNHPSYPSAHSCQSGGWEGILLRFFPGKRREIRAMAAEASESRIMGGLHYRFDGNAGLELGREAARLTLKRGVE